MPTPVPCRISRRTPLAACLASIFALTTQPSAIAETWVVNSCDEDSHPTDPGPNTGTLRWAIEQSDANVDPGADTIDLTGLIDANACTDSRITLTTAELSIGHADVTIQGPGASVLTIDGSGLGPPSVATGVLRDYHPDGTLTLKDIAISGGHRVSTDTFANGGCIASQANVTLVNSSVSGCDVKSTGVPTRGGGIYASGGLAYASVTLINSNVHDSYVDSDVQAAGGGVFAMGDVVVMDGSVLENDSATSHYSGVRDFANGGGAYARGNLSLTNAILRGNTASGDYAAGGGAMSLGGFSASYATIDGNTVTAATIAVGGGIETLGYPVGSAGIAHSTISNNSAGTAAGGLSADSNVDPDRVLEITDSTISGNSSGHWFGGVFSNRLTVRIYNSTIVFNTAASGTYAAYAYAPGLGLVVRSAGETVTLQSTLIAGNTYGSTEVDFSIAKGTATVGGANNLIRVTDPGTGAPGGTIDKVCPLLGPLRDNGGPTMTHRLFSSSPAIDTGNSDLAGAFDQRGGIATNGTFDYVRVSGGFADIGAYEVQQDDVVFDAAFEGCPDLP